MSDITQDIKDKLDIVEVIRSYITVLPAGRNFKAHCPFHKEKTPSFMISPERRSWHCFGGCNEGGDVIAFVMKYENVEFYDALSLLAERAGIDPARLSRGASEYKKYEALYAINAAAKDFFALSMTPEVRQYCAERGLTGETVLEFELGYAPSGSDALLRALVAKGFAPRDIEQAGLIFRTDRGTYWDRFRGRLMFPLYNYTGRVVGFTGRVLPSTPNADQTGKYVNSPETPIFSKSKVLYGFHKAKGAIRDANAAVLVEGQMDFLMVYQSGIRNAVAVSGTALTHEHLKTMRRLADRLLLCFDNDEAGQRAIERSIDLGLQADFSIGIIALPQKDPADMVRENPRAMAELIAAAKPVRAFYFERYLGNAVHGDPDVLKKGVRALLMKIKTMGSPLEQAGWMKELTAKTGIGEHTLSKEMEQLAEARAPVFKEVKAPMPVVRLGRKELIIQRMAQLGGTPEFITATARADSLSDAVVLEAAFESEKISPEDRERELAALAEELYKEQYKERMAGVRAVIVASQATGDEARLASALREFDNIQRELYTKAHGTAQGKKTEKDQGHASSAG